MLCLCNIMSFLGDTAGLKHCRVCKHFFACWHTHSLYVVRRRKLIFDTKTWEQLLLQQGLTLDIFFFLECKEHKSSDIEQISYFVQLAFHGKPKGKLISDLSITPRTIINQEMLPLTTTSPELTETQHSFTVTALIHTCVTKVLLSSTLWTTQWGPALLWHICTGVADLSFVCNDPLTSICWLAKSYRVTVLCNGVVATNSQPFLKQSSQFRVFVFVLVTLNLSIKAS